VFSVNETAQEITIPTLALNRLTIGLGLVFDFSLQTEFRASAVKGESVPVIVQDQHQRGIVPPVPFVALRPFAVDSKRMRSFYQWWAPALGISLTEPLDHLYLGLLVEPFPGLGAIGGYHFHREPTLAGGYQIGDRIPGGVVATDKRWADPARRDLFLGLNIDASVLVNLLGKLK
jgi:hypothetical protein